MLKTFVIGQFMSPCPHGIEPHLKLKDARKRMDELKVHHLPVQIGGRLIGVLSERDIQYIGTLADLGPWENVSVEEAMTPEPYQVATNAPFYKVIGEMAVHRYGCVLITEGERLKGIFTSSDALKLLAEMTAPK